MILFDGEDSPQEQNHKMYERIAAFVGDAKCQGCAFGVQIYSDTYTSGDGSISIRTTMILKIEDKQGMKYWRIMG